MHASTSAISAVGSKRATTLPARSMMNFVKFHSLSSFQYLIFFILHFTIAAANLAAALRSSSFGLPLWIPLNSPLQ